MALWIGAMELERFSKYTLPVNPWRSAGSGGSGFDVIVCSATDNRLIDQPLSLAGCSGDTLWDGPSEVSFWLTCDG